MIDEVDRQIDIVVLLPKSLVKDVEEHLGGVPVNVNEDVTPLQTSFRQTSSLTSSPITNISK